MDTSCKIFLRKDRVNANKENPVYLRLITNRKPTQISLDVWVLPENWDSAEKKVKRTDKEHILKNLILTKAKDKLNKTELDSVFNDKITTNEDIKNILRNNYGKTEFYHFVENKIKINKEYSPETKRTYLSQLSKLKQFRKDLTFREITPSFIQSYKNYMIETLGNKVNTYGKSISMLRTFFYWAKEEGLVKDNSFAGLRIKKVEGNRQHLKENEILILENLLNTGLSKSLENVLKYFLFSCFTGIRFTDIKKLTWNNIKEEIENGKESKIIDFEMTKTKIFVQVPLIERAAKLLPERNICNKLFKVLTNQPTNRYLKRIMALSGIDKQISYHCARHTFATYGLSLGIPIEVISKLLGHTTIKMTQIYAKVNNDLKIREMAKMNR